MSDQAILGLILILILLIPIAFMLLVAMKDRKRAAKWRASFSETQQYDLLDLVKYGFVTARATGQTITGITAELNNRTDRRIYGLISPGTYFIASGAHQNMVIYGTNRFVLYRNETKRIVLPAACINATRPVPRDKDSFTSVAKANRALALFLERAGGQDPMVIQAGVWAITDDYSAAQIQRTLVTTVQGHKQPAISLAQIAAAKRILNELHISNRL